MEKEKNTEEYDEEDEKKKIRMQKTAKYYYSRKEIQKAIFSFSQNKEVVPGYFLGGKDVGFGKRPDILEYETDVQNLALKGATSFHCSEELWKNPLNLHVGLTQEELNELRVGWDLLLDIDCKFLEYGKIASWLLTEALYFHNIKNFGVKFSGSKGFHIGLSFESFPKKVKDIDIKNYFPQGPRLIAAYLKEMIRKPLREKIMEISTIKEIEEATKISEKDLIQNKEFNPFSILEIDTILISPRHLYRMPYSLNEKTGLASICIKPEQINSFKPGWAFPERVFPKPFMPKPEENESKELILQALDWEKTNNDFKRRILNLNPNPNQIKREYSEISFSEVKEDNFPPCIKNILSGVKQDGRKRALFVLLNFLKSIGYNHEQITEKINEWNKKNYKPLKDTYLRTQLDWFSRQAKRLPPNCNLEEYYKGMSVCYPDGFCSKVKNPINYFVFKSRAMMGYKYKNENTKRHQTNNLKSKNSFPKPSYSYKYKKEEKSENNDEKNKKITRKRIYEKKDFAEVPNYLDKNYVKY